MNKAKVLIGADPEAFVRRGPTTIHHCIGILGGDKNSPRKVLDGAVQEDNVLFEFNVDASEYCDTFAQRIQAVMYQGEEILGDAGLRLVPRVSSHIYDHMQGFPEKAFEFGCTPDYNGLTGEENPRPTAENLMLRTAGGHVHIGWSHLGEVSKELQSKVIIACDYLLGLQSLLEDPDTRRRELYGKAGACRYKEYGVEYRTLSNYWIWDKAHIMAIHKRAQLACGVAHDAVAFELLTALVSPAEVQATINSGDAQMAAVYLEVIANATK